MVGKPFRTGLWKVACYSGAIAIWPLVNADKPISGPHDEAAIEFAAEGIRFNAIAPGVVNTPMNPVEAHEFLKQFSPMKRLAEVGEVADLLLYLESADFVNGEVVHLDGGAHAGKW